MRPDGLFANYERLVDKVDRFLDGMPACGCPETCHRCCRSGLTLFPVEAGHLRKAFLRLPEPMRGRLEAGAGAGGTEHCPLLLDGLCTLYPARPILCRTHGFPSLLGEEEGGRGPRLSPGCEHRARINGHRRGEVGETRVVRALDLNHVSQVLVAVNARFLAEAHLGSRDVPLRLPISEVVSTPILGGLCDADL